MKAIKMPKAKKRLIRNGTTALTICTIDLTAIAPSKKGYPLVLSRYGDFLKQARLDNCLTRFELGLELEVYESTIEKWERGATEPNSDNKQKIIQFLGYNPLQKLITI